MSDEERNTRVVGRVLRLLMGLGMSGLAVHYLLPGSFALFASTAGVVVGETIGYCALHLVISKYFARVNATAGAFIAVTPVVLVFVFGGAVGQLGTLLYIGISLVLTAIRSEGGCEVMTIPGMLLGNRTHLVCIVFCPVDWAEKRLQALVSNQ